MAIPAPAIPSGNAYTLNVGSAAEARSPLPDFSAAAALLLRRWKVPVRMHASGDGPQVAALRESLAAAGARASAFSPAPSAEIPGEGFWKTTLIAVEAHPKTGLEKKPEANFWAEERAGRKVEWDPLLVALFDRFSPADFPVDMPAIPDLCCVRAFPDPEDAATIAGRWTDAGAKAVCVVTPGAVAWKSNGSAFGKSEGFREAGAASPPGAERDLGLFTAGVVAGMIRELLGENLFDKTFIRADRECLEMRPLRLGRAVLHGVAALEAAGQLSPTDAVLKKGGGFPEMAETALAQLRGPESRPWTHKGR